MNDEMKNVPAGEFRIPAEEEKAGGKSYTHSLNPPFTYEGKTWGNLTFHWGQLTAKDSLIIENEMAAAGKVLVVPELSGEFLSRMAVRACEEKIALNAFMALPLGDYNKIRSRARSFLLRTES